jgi:UDP-glucose 4-epimerase
VVSKLMKCVSDGKPLVIHGDGNQTRDFVHVDDVCRAICLSLQTPQSYGEVLQIASGTETSINDVAMMIGEIAGVEVEIVHRPKRKGDIERSCSDIAKARKLLAFEPELQLAEGLRALHRSHQAEIRGS